MEKEKGGVLQLISRRSLDAAERVNNNEGKRMGCG